MNNNKLRSLEEASLFLKQHVEIALKKSIEKNDSAVLILPGGTSILHFFDDLMHIDVPWHKITIGLSDERCVPLDHFMSNEKQLREKFLNFLPHFNYLSLCEQLIDRIKKYPTITVLGLGSDGHVASLFSNEYELWKGKDIGLYQTKNQSPNRISLTEKTLLSSSYLYLLIVGKEKNDMFDSTNPSAFYLSSIYSAATCICSDSSGKS